MRTSDGQDELWDVLNITVGTRYVMKSRRSENVRSTSDTLSTFSCRVVRTICMADAATSAGRVWKMPGS